MRAAKFLRLHYRDWFPDDCDVAVSGRNPQNARYRAPADSYTGALKGAAGVDRKLALLTIILAGLLCSAALSQAQGVRVLQPTEGDTVRGVVKVIGEKPHPEEGYMTLSIQSPTGQREFIGATVAPFTLKWDSRARTSNGERRFPDGRYELEVTGHSDSGDTIGESTVNVTVANNVEDPAVEGGVTLRYKFARNDRMVYRLDGRCLLRVAEDKDIKSRDAMKKYAAEQRMALAQQQKMQMTYLELTSDVQWAQTVIGLVEGGGGMVRYTLSNGWLDFGTGVPQMIPRLGKTFTLLVRPNGKQEPKRPDAPTLTWADQILLVEATSLKPGDHWDSTIGFVPHDMVYPEPDASGAKFVRARNTLEGFEWHSGYKCARIRSTFHYDGPVTLTNGFRFNTKMSGERTTYFAYEQGKIIAFTERLEHEFELPATGAVGGAIPGTPGVPGAIGPAGGGMPAGLPGAEMPFGFGGAVPPGGLGPGAVPPGGLGPGVMPPGGGPMPPGTGVPGVEAVPGVPGIPGAGGPPVPGGLVPGGAVGPVPGVPGAGAPMPGAIPGVPGGGPGPGMGGTTGYQQLPAKPLKFKLIVYHDVAPVQSAAQTSRRSAARRPASAVAPVDVRTGQ